MGRFKLVQPSTGTSAGAVTGIDGTATAKSASWSFSDTDRIRTALVTTGASTITATLPQASTNPHRVITIMKVDSGVGKITIAKHASDGATVIDGAHAGTDIGTAARGQGASITFQSDGTNWWTVATHGDTISSTQSTPQNAGTTNQFANTTSISLPPGVWSINGSAQFTLNGATVTVCIGGVSAFSANTTTDHVLGENTAYIVAPTAATDTSVAIPTWRARVTSTATYYLKARFTYSAGTPQHYGRITAVRIA